MSLKNVKGIFQNAIPIEFSMRSMLNILKHY